MKTFVHIDNYLLKHTTMQHVALFHSESEFSVFRNFSCETMLCETLNRRGSFFANMRSCDCASHNTIVVYKKQNNNALFSVVEHGAENHTCVCKCCLTLSIPSYMFPLKYVEVWVQPTHLAKIYKQPSIENMCGVLKSQIFGKKANSASVKMYRRSFGYSKTIASSCGNLSFDNGYTQALFRGVFDMQKFKALFSKLDIDLDIIHVSLVVFSAQLGRKISIAAHNKVASQFAALSGLKIVYCMDDQNNTLRFSKCNSDKITMNFILNKNGGVTVRYFTNVFDVFHEDNIKVMQEEIVYLMDIVLSIS